PKPSHQVQLLPGQSSDFFPPLARERQKLDDASVRSTNLLGSKDDLGEFQVVQNAIPSDLFGGQRHAFGGRLVENGAPHAPAQECLDRLQRLVGGCGSTSLFNRRDDGNHVALADLMNAPPGQRLSYLPTKQSRGFGSRAVLGQMLRNECLEQI